MNDPCIQELLLLVLSAFVAEYGPILIIMEDLHHFDTVSLQLVADTLRSLSQGCLIIASMRPGAGIFKPVTTNQVSSVIISKVKQVGQRKVLCIVMPG